MYLPYGSSEARGVGILIKSSCQHIVHKLIPEISNHFEGDLKEDEIFQCLNTFPNGKSPGTDGLSVEWYKRFGPDIKDFLLKSINFSLLNQDYKLIAKCIANRIKSTLPYIIHEDQKGFMKKRYIGENLIKILALMTYSKQKI